MVGSAVPGSTGCDRLRWESNPTTSSIRICDGARLRPSAETGDVVVSSVRLSRRPLESVTVGPRPTPVPVVGSIGLRERAGVDIEAARIGVHPSCAVPTAD
ncbi:hypothetical protein C486_10554 [Natrinema gari JCM 14663]|uniref:Uncharacterized protein n=1 Tax=Natrinema gari JCM 14663 TaxID=1230459 RepID=L9Z0K7_9EURY|nr:hypothetical protein C486_10554 [Natrinema gari JCM 14663]